MENSSSNSAAEGYKETSLTVQNLEGVIFIQTDVSVRTGDAILDLGCGTGELSAYLAELVGPEEKIVGVDPDNERILLAQKPHGEIKNLSFVEGSASNFPGIGSESYDIVFSNHVIHWIPDKQQAFNNMFINIQYEDHNLPFVLNAFKELNPKKEGLLCEMVECREKKTKIENYCCSAGFRIIKCYDTLSTQLVFQSIESLLNWVWSTMHGAFDPKLVTEERLQRYYPYSSRDGKPPFDFREIKQEWSMCRLIAEKP